MSNPSKAWVQKKEHSLKVDRAELENIQQNHLAQMCLIGYLNACPKNEAQKDSEAIIKRRAPRSCSGVHRGGSGEAILEFLPLALASVSNRCGACSQSGPISSGAHRTETGNTNERLGKV